MNQIKNDDLELMLHELSTYITMSRGRQSNFHPNSLGWLQWEQSILAAENNRDKLIALMPMKVFVSNEERELLNRNPA